MTTPKPCPFCGHTKIEFCDSRRPLWGKLQCERCLASVESYKKDSADIEWHERAIASWNRRAVEREPTPTLQSPLSESKIHDAYVKSGSYLEFARMIEKQHGIDAQKSIKPEFPKSTLAKEFSW